MNTEMDQVERNQAADSDPAPSVTLTQLAAICGFLSSGNERGAIAYARKEWGMSDYTATKMVRYGVLV